MLVFRFLVEGNATYEPIKKKLDDLEQNVLAKRGLILYF